MGTVRVVLLCATQDEARAQASDAGLKPHSKDVIAPGGVATLHGLTLEEADLIIEFPGFRARRDAGDIIESLHKTIAMSPGAGPVWRTAGANKSKDRLPA